MDAPKTNNPADFVCPRCGGLIPSNENWGEYPGEISRHTRARGVKRLEVCSACGEEEAVEQYLGRLSRLQEYPILNDATITRRFEAIAILAEREDHGGGQGST